MVNEDISISSKTRLLWLDWMKVLSMLCIVLGHCWVPGNKYLYVFNVPCFYILSGYTAHHIHSKSLFWKKLFWNMVVPMMLFFAIDFVFYLLSLYINGTFHIKYIFEGPLLAIIGMQGQNYAAGGLKAMWFVYTLCLCKIIFQYIHPSVKNKVSIVLSLVFLAVAIYLHKANVLLMNSFANVLLAFPFFCLGHIISCKVKIPPIIHKSHLFRFSIIALISLLLVFICGRYNNIVMFYKCSYGNSIFLFLLGGVCGTILMYVLSSICSLAHNRLIINLLGGGDNRNSRFASDYYTYI